MYTHTHLWHHHPSNCGNCSLWACFIHIKAYKWGYDKIIWPWEVSTHTKPILVVMATPPLLLAGWAHLEDWRRPIDREAKRWHCTSVALRWVQRLAWNNTHHVANSLTNALQQISWKKQLLKISYGLCAFISHVCRSSFLDWLCVQVWHEDHY